MATVTINTEGVLITVSSPYHPDFPARARKLGGSWDDARKLWSFDPRDLERVRELCRDIFGTDGTEGEGELVTLRVVFAETADTYDRTCYVAGRQVARSWGRDGGAVLGEGVVVLEGGFGSGGSRKNPTLTVRAGTVIEVRDVPAGAKREADLGGEVELLGDATASTDFRLLTAERARLLERLAEVEEALAQWAGTE